MLNKIKQFIIKFKMWFIGLFIIPIALAAGTQFNVDEVNGNINEPLTEADKIIIQELPSQEQIDDILYRGTYKINKIDSINGQLVVTEFDEPIFVTKDFYNNCRERGTTKEDCLIEIQNRIDDEIERNRKMAQEEIEMFMSEKIDYTDELIGIDFNILKYNEKMY